MLSERWKNDCEQEERYGGNERGFQAEMHRGMISRNQVVGQIESTLPDFTRLLHGTVPLLFLFVVLSLPLRLLRETSHSIL